MRKERLHRKRRYKGGCISITKKITGRGVTTARRLCNALRKS